MRSLVFVCLVALLSGCVSDPAGQTNVRQPVSQQQVNGETRNRAKIHTQLAFAYFEERMMSNALDEARIALSIDSGFAPAYNLLALIYADLRDSRMAEENFERALQLAPGDPEISSNYGWFLCQTQRGAKAQAYFQTAIRNPLYATPSIALTNAGACYLLMKDEKNAEDSLLRAMREDPGNLRALQMLVELNYRMGRLGEAKLRLSDLHKRRDPSAESAWWGMLIERKLGNRAEEARFVAVLRNKFPDSVEYQKFLQGQIE